MTALEKARNADVIVKASGVGVFDELLEAAVLQLRNSSNTIIFWDVDAPATLDRIKLNPFDPFAALIPDYDIILTYGGGEPVVQAYKSLGARECVPIYNALDPTTHHPVRPKSEFEADLVFLGNRLPDRETRVEEFFMSPASSLPDHRFLLGGSGWSDKQMPDNVRYLDHVFTSDHNAFNSTPRAVLNISRESMARYGFSPATRVFEAAGAGACIITDKWEGVELFLEPNREILIAQNGEEVAEYVRSLTSDEACSIGQAALSRVRAEHTYQHRAVQLESLLLGIRQKAISLANTADKAVSRHLNIVMLGLSITSSWGNGHATTYRGLVRGLAELGHDVLFLERDVPWYSANRDMPDPPFGRTELYHSLSDLKDRFAADVRDADLVIVGSYIPEGVAVGEWVTSNAIGLTAFYDIDTPVTLSKLENNDLEYLSRELIPRYQLYLSFTGGPVLGLLESFYHSPSARPLYCSFDPQIYYPEKQSMQWDMGYLGTYSDDRQPVLEKLMLEPARQWKQGRFVVAGPQYPHSIDWPINVYRMEHVSQSDHRRFYNSQRFTLNITRADMIRLGFSPSVRLFEAAACGTPIISDWWDGLDMIFEPEREILIARSQADVLSYLRDIPEQERLEIGKRARDRVIIQHTALHRAQELENYVLNYSAR
jgi:spore maturation protein CgeB